MRSETATPPEIGAPRSPALEDRDDAVGKPDRLSRDLKSTARRGSYQQPLRHLSLLHGTTPWEKKMTDYRVNAGEAQEDQVTAAIEKYTAQLPSSAYLALAIASMAASVTFKIAKRDHASLFVGQWAAPLLIMGIYNKMVKQHGSDAQTRR